MLSLLKMIKAKLQKKRHVTVIPSEKMVLAAHESDSWDAFDSSLSLAWAVDDEAG